jgi:cytochrome aa3-600 menaquinol oxidase subunit 3
MDLHKRLSEYTATPLRRRILKLSIVNAAAFSALLGYMFWVRAHATDWPVDSPPFEFGSLLMIFSMAMSGICASVTMAVGAHSAARNKPEEAERWVAIAIASWLIFLFLEIVEWVRMVYLLELGPKTPFGGTFLMITGAHWLAVIVCSVWFTFVVADVRRRDILAAALYSHFLALWWIVIILVVYLPNMNPLQDL